MILRKITMLILFGIIGIMPVAWGVSIQEIAQSLMTSTVILEMEKSGGSVNGVGFIIDEGKIATNYHVIEGMSVGTVRLIGTKKKYEITSVLKTDIDHDLAIVGVTSADNRIAPVMEVGDSDLMSPGDKVYALANPQKVIGSFEQGTIESIAQENTLNLSGRIFKGKLFAVTLPVQPGASGGAVLNGEGEIIGVVVAKFRDRDGGLIIPINYAKALLNQDQSSPVAIEIPDVNLKKLLRKGLEKDVGDPITVQDMLSISELSGRYYGIKNLSGLEYAKNLRSLNLYHNDISDLSPLSGLIDLEYLNLNSNKIANISPLSKLTGLKVLNLRASSRSDEPRFNDITPLSNLTDLEILNIGENSVWDLYPLSKMGKLKELYVHSNLIFDIESLLMLKSLKVVDLRNNPLNQNSRDSILSMLTKKSVKSYLSYLYFSGSQLIPKGETITLDLKIKDAQNLSTINLDINVYTQDYSLVEVTEGDFMGQSDALTFFIEGTQEGANIEDISVVRLNKGGASGDGTVLQLKIRGDNIGAKHIYFDAELIDIDGDEALYGYERSYWLEVVASTDVNGDGVVDIDDLKYIIERMGKREVDSEADLNGDEYVNVKDFAIVAAALSDSPIASIDTGQSLEPYLAPSVVLAKPDRTARAKHDATVSHETIRSWIDMMEIANDGGTYYIGGIQNLKNLLRLYDMRVRIPDKTALLNNYPNPFNPETWIPYQLSKASSVRIMISDVTGQIVRQFDLGFQTAGEYISKKQSVYWDGKNELGQAVSSGIYFFTLFAGDYSATQKMVILK